MNEHRELERLAARAALDPAEREELGRHVAGCAQCRAAVAAEDPSGLFALLALDAVPAERLERLDSRIAAAADAEAGGGAARGRRWLAAAAAVAGLGLGVWLGRPLGRVPAETAALAPTEAALAAAAEAGAARSPEELELYLPDEAQVVNFTVGETRVVMIFNEELEL